MLDIARFEGAAKQHATKMGYKNFIICGAVRTKGNEVTLNVEYDTTYHHYETWRVVISRGTSAKFYY